MKHGRKPTRAESKWIQKAGLDSWGVLVVKVFPNYLLVVDKLSGVLHEVPKR